MGDLGKIIGLGLGVIMRGPIGGVLGAIVGTAYDMLNDKLKLEESHEKAIYHAYLVSLFVYIAKADGQISPAEVKIIRDFFKNKGLNSTEMEQIKEALKVATKQENVDIKTIVEQINIIFDYTTRLNILELCFVIASSDKSISTKEEEKLDLIAGLMNINKKDQFALKLDYVDITETKTDPKANAKKQSKEEQIDDDLERLKQEMKGNYRKKDDNKKQEQKKEQNKQQSNQSSNKQRDPYEVLNVKKGSTKEEVKAAYLKLVSIHHPDKFTDAKQKKDAEEKIKEINLAYQELKKIL